MPSAARHILRQALYLMAAILLGRHIMRSILGAAYDGRSPQPGRPPALRVNTVWAAFRSRDEAERAAQALRAAGFEAGNIHLIHGGPELLPNPRPRWSIGSRRYADHLAIYQRCLRCGDTLVCLGPERNVLRAEEAQRLLRRHGGTEDYYFRPLGCLF